ncbi:unnamed protein product [Moneuplotes crassus]|uniref:Uncharacterized protein n=1 Tax=Euplotes crassus TaxID=5936 RepID=A0AAD1UB24_EUPCR|nr:unnamed protein product [Moneuplotes crassus]
MEPSPFHPIPRSHFHAPHPSSPPVRAPASATHKKTQEEEDQKEAQRLDRAKGSVVGALCGDAIGTFLEFCEYEIDEQFAEFALSMPGGGHFQVGPGQVTDDGELTMCLLQGLSYAEEFSEIEMTKSCGRYYIEWMNSKPFDCGITIGNAFYKVNPKYPEMIKKRADIYCQDSQSNGSLMRSTPLAVFCHRMEVPNTEDFKAEDWEKHRDCVFKMAKFDASFTHSNKEVHYIEGLYIYMITLIINGVELDKVYDIIVDEISNSDNEVYYQWLEESKKDKLGNLSSKMGWMKHAFICCLRYLRLAAQELIDGKQPDSTFYTRSITEILIGGGDTDTNACIAGGLLGAIIGYEGLPKEMKDKVMNWDYKEHGGIKRPPFLVPKGKIDGLVEVVFSRAPAEMWKEE